MLNETQTKVIVRPFIAVWDSKLISLFCYILIIPLIIMVYINKKSVYLFEWLWFPAFRYWKFHLRIFQFYSLEPKLTYNVKLLYLILRSTYKPMSSTDSKISSTAQKWQSTTRVFWDSKPRPLDVPKRKIETKAH